MAPRKRATEHIQQQAIRKELKANQQALSSIQDDCKTRKDTNSKQYTPKTYIFIYALLSQKSR